MIGCGIRSGRARLNLTTVVASLLGQASRLRVSDTDQISAPTRCHVQAGAATTHWLIRFAISVNSFLLPQALGGPQGVIAGLDDILVLRMARIQEGGMSLHFPGAGLVLGGRHGRAAG